LAHRGRFQSWLQVSIGKYLHFFFHLQFGFALNLCQGFSTRPQEIYIVGILGFEIGDACLEYLVVANPGHDSGCGLGIPIAKNLVQGGVIAQSESRDIILFNFLNGQNLGHQSLGFPQILGLLCLAALLLPQL
jgi:hypothetical protein